MDFPWKDMEKESLFIVGKGKIFGFERAL